MRGNAGAPSEGASAVHEPGGNGVGKNQVVSFQRARMITAMLEEVAERGASNVSVAHIVTRSGVSRRTFYEIFRNREDCYLAAFDQALKDVVAVVVPAFERTGSWRVRVRAALTSLLESLQHEPRIGRLLIVESLAAGPKALERRQDVLTLIVPIVERGCAESKAGKHPPPLTAEGIIGAVVSILHDRLLKRHAGALVELTGPLMAIIVLPYLGTSVARAELTKPVPKCPPRQALVRADPLRGIEMRLTYRTLRVLTGLGQTPGATNRQVGEASGIDDQGQISKLLRRLERLGLIENALAGRDRGRPNGWVLTGRGRELEQGIRERARG